MAGGKESGQVALNKQVTIASVLHKIMI